jgi:hypothetical protein
MYDDDISLCLTPQAFSNINPNVDIFNNINQQFWEYVLPGSDAWGYIACTGARPPSPRSPPLPSSPSPPSPHRPAPSPRLSSTRPPAALGPSPPLPLPLRPAQAPTSACARARWPRSSGSPSGPSPRTTRCPWS